MFVEMPGKRLQHRVGFALAVHRPSQAGVQAPDGTAHELGALLNTLPAAPGMLPLVLGDRLQFAQRLGPHRLDFPLVVEHRFKLAFLAAHVPDCLGLVQPKVPLLNDLGSPGSLPGEDPRIQRQDQRVNRLRRRMQQQPGDI